MIDLSSATAQSLVLLFALLPESIIETMLTPLNPYIVKSLIKDHSQVGRYVGMIGSAFYMPLFVMNTAWGAYSDKYGRKPVLTMGLYVFTISILIYCLSKNVWICIISRFIAGVFGANSTITKGMLGELMTTKKDQAWAYAMYGAVFGVAGIAGPIFGGILVSNYKEEDISLSQGQATFWAAYPFVWPGLVGSVMGLVGLYAVLFHLNETRGTVTTTHLPLETFTSSKQSSPISHQEISMLEDDDLNVDDNIRSRNSPVSPDGQGLLKRSPFKHEDKSLKGQRSNHVFSNQNINTNNRSHILGNLSIPVATILPITLYGFITAANMMYFVALPLAFAASKNNGGLGLSPNMSSAIMSMLAIAKLFMQMVFFQPALSYFGLAGTYRLGMIFTALSNFLMPGAHEANLWLGFILVLMGTGEAFAYLSVIIMITTSASIPSYSPSSTQLPSSSEEDNFSNNSNQLGLVHGIASTTAAIIRATTSSFSGFLWEWSTSGATPMPWIVFAITALMASVGILLSFTKKANAYG